MGRGRLELPCTRRLVLSEVCLPYSTTGPCPGRASNPQNCGPQRQASTDCATWTFGARGRTRTYVAKRQRVTTGQFCCSLTRVLTRFVKELGGEPGTRTPMCRRRRNLSRILGYQLPMLSAALRGRDQYQSKDDRDKLDRRVQLSVLCSRLVAVSMPR